MIIIFVSLFEVQNGAQRKIAQHNKKVSTFIEFCTVTEVDTTNKVVSAYFLGSGYTRKGVSYCYPAYNEGCGIMFVPSVGSIGVATRTNAGEYVILSFFSLVTENDGVTTRDNPSLGNYNIPNLLEGELLFKGKSGAFIKLDSVGGMTLSSSVYGLLKLDENGDYILNVENGETFYNGNLTENYAVEYTQHMKIVKGLHNPPPGNKVDSSVELCYGMYMENSDAFIAFDVEGNIHMSGTIKTY